MVDRRKESEGIKGWLLVYVVALAIITVHGMALTIASIIINSKPSAIGPLPPLSFLLFYVITNALLIIYAVVLFVLMFRKRKAAISNNIIFNAMSIFFLVCWHFVGEKSNVGTLVDALPSLISFWYFLVSKRVRTTFTEPFSS